MSKESLHSVDRRILLRETGTSESLSRNHATNTDVTSSNGVMTFNGSSSDILYDSQLGWCADGLSIRVKAKFDADTLKTAFAIGVPGGGDGVTIGCGVETGIGTDNHLIYAFWHSGAWRVCDSGITPVAGQEYDIVAVNDGTDIKLYVDGVLKDTVAGQGGAFNGYNYVVRLGRRFNVATLNYFDGDIELVEIYQGALSPEEISLLADNRLYSGYVKDGLVLDCDYIQGTGMNLVDRSASYTETGVEYKHGLGAWFDGTARITYDGVGDMGLEDFTVTGVIGDSHSKVGFKHLLGVWTGSLVNKWWYLAIYSDETFRCNNSFVNTTLNVGKYLDNCFFALVFDRDGNSTLKICKNNIWYSGFSDISGYSTEPVPGACPVTVGQIGTVNPSWPKKTIIKSVQIYKGKCLSQEELVQNYMYSKQRGWVN